MRTNLPMSMHSSSTPQTSFKTVEKLKNRAKSIIDFSKIASDSKKAQLPAASNQPNHQWINAGKNIMGTLPEKKLSSNHSQSQKQPLMGYEQIIQQFHLELPTPQEKVFEFLQMPLFDRLSKHTDLIEHFLKKYSFFKMHPKSMLCDFAKKVYMASNEQLGRPKTLHIVADGTCEYKGTTLRVGQLVQRNQLDLLHLRLGPQCKLIGLASHEYQSIIGSFLASEKSQYESFLEGLSLMKAFPQKAQKKIWTTMGLHFCSRGEALYSPDSEAKELFVVYSGKLMRKVIVQIDQTNYIPVQKFTKIARTTSRAYQHKIEFTRQDLIGVSQLLDKTSQRKEIIEADEDSVLISLDRVAMEEHLDDYIVDRMRKYHLRKYPQNYDQLCKKYLKAQQDFLKAEHRKIEALRASIITVGSKKTENINQIVKIFESNIRNTKLQNLISKKVEDKKLQID